MINELLCGWLVVVVEFEYLFSYRTRTNEIVVALGRKKEKKLK